MRHGFLLIDKPRGPTSHDIVGMVRRTLSERSIGHLGTLDPGASGLLVLAVGAKALKVVEFFKDMTKEYDAEIRLGAVSSTYDGDGIVEDVQAKPGWVQPDLQTVRELIFNRFTGRIDQVPPAHSAVHINGQRAYDMARRGEEVIMPVREVDVRACDITMYEYPTLKVHVACSSGTYIRSLAHDLGAMLRCGGYLKELRRTHVGEWNVANAVTADDAIWTRVLPLKDVLKSFPSIELTPVEAEHIRHGRMIDRDVQPDTFAWFEGLPMSVLIAPAPGKARARKVL